MVEREMMSTKNKGNPSKLIVHLISLWLLLNKIALMRKCFICTERNGLVHLLILYYFNNLLNTYKPAEFS